MNTPLLRFFASLGALLILAALLWGVLRWRDAVSDIQTTDNAYVRGEITVLSPRIAGYVVEITADDDQPVEPKQVLVRIDPRDDRATYDRARALVSQAETQLTESRSRLLAQEAKIAVAAPASCWQRPPATPRCSTTPRPPTPPPAPPWRRRPPIWASNVSSSAWPPPAAGRDSNARSIRHAMSRPRIRRVCRSIPILR